MTVPDLLNDPTVKKIAAKHKKSSAQVLLRFINQKNIAVIPKSVTPSRIKENFDIFNFTLDSSDIKELESLDKGSAGRICWFDSYVFMDRIKNYEINCGFFLDGLVFTNILLARDRR